jgi:hypothetical protein
MQYARQKLLQRNVVDVQVQTNRATFESLAEILKV